MDTLINKRYLNLDYTNRYNGRPYYYDTIAGQDFLSISLPILETTQVYSHVVTELDTYDNLALKYYNNPTYWWVIARYNNALDPFEKPIARYKILQIPNISSISFGDFR